MIGLDNKLLSKKSILIIGGFIILAILFFGSGIKGDFVYDDLWVIKANPTLNFISNLPSQFISPYHYNQPETGLYRPFTVVSFSLNWIFSKDPVYFHILNIILHAINSFLVFWLIFKIFNSRKLAYLTALFFLFLPIHAEAVTFISGRADLLAFLFSMLSILAVVYKKYWWSAGAFLLAISSKESALAVLPIIFFWWLYFEKFNFITSVKKIFYFVPAAALYIILRYIALGRNFLSNDASYIYNPLKFSGFLPRILTSFKITALYFWKTLFPFQLSADYSYNQIKIARFLFDPAVLTGILIILMFLFFIILPKIRNKPVGFAALLFIFPFLIVSNFIFPIGTIMAERVFYFPSLGLAMILGVLFSKLTDWKFKKMWLIMFTVIILIYGLVIFNYSHIWLNEETLFKDMVLKSPASAHAKTNLGIYYVQNNQTEKGKTLLEESFNIAPDNLPTLNTLGIISEKENRFSDAEKFYLKAIAIQPLYFNALSNLSRMYIKLGQYNKVAQNNDLKLFLCAQLKKTGQTESGFPAPNNFTCL